AGIYIGKRTGFSVTKQQAISKTDAPPIYHRLTFRRGAVYSARFAPDGHTIVYSAAWDGKPAEIFTGIPESSDHRSLGLSNAEILSISNTGELAVLLRCTYRNPDFGFTGTLARVP